MESYDKENITQKAKTLFINLESLIEKFTQDVNLLEGLKYQFLDLTKSLKGINLDYNELPTEKIKKTDSMRTLEHNNSDILRRTNVKLYEKKECHHHHYIEENSIHKSPERSKTPIKVNRTPVERAKTPINLRETKDISNNKTPIKTQNIKPVIDRTGDKSAREVKKTNNINVKKEETKKEEVKKPDSKKVDSRREEIKKAETKKVETKKEEVKKKDLNSTTVINKGEARKSGTVPKVDISQKQKNNEGDKKVEIETIKPKDIAEVKNVVIKNEEHIKQPVEVVKDIIKVETKKIVEEPVNLVTKEVVTEKTVRENDVVEANLVPDQKISINIETKSEQSKHPEQPKKIEEAKLTEQAKEPEKPKQTINNTESTKSIEAIKIPQIDIQSIIKPEEVKVVETKAQIKTPVVIEKSSLSSQLINKKNLNLSNNKLECFYHIINSGYLQYGQTFYYANIVKEFIEKGLNKKIISNKISQIEKEISSKEEFLKKNLNDNNEVLIEKIFIASKTAQNGLNFVNKEEENNLSTKEQPEEIINIFKLIYLYLNEPIPVEVNIIDHLIHNLLKKYKTESLKSLFLNYISKNVYFSENQLSAIIEHVQKFPKILSSSDYLRINRSVSYMTFFMKEVYEYCSNKYDGVYINSLRKVRNDLKNLKVIYERYNKIL